VWRRDAGVWRRDAGVWRRDADVWRRDADVWRYTVPFLLICLPVALFQQLVHWNRTGQNRRGSAEKISESWPAWQVR
jgi:hypothetical protein